MKLISHTDATKKIIVDSKLLGADKAFLNAGRSEKEKKGADQKNVDIDFGENSKVSRL